MQYTRGVVMFPRRVISLFRLGIFACIAAWATSIVIAVLTAPITSQFATLLACGWLPAFIVWIALRFYYAHVRRMVQHMDYLICPKCGYDLHGCDSFGACPECGRAYARDKLPLDWHRGGFAPRLLFWRFYRKR
jgi:hypothetical protein